MKGLCVCAAQVVTSQIVSTFQRLLLLLCRSAGIKVIKHGNKSITSNSGSTDLLNQMNIQTTTVDDTPNQLNEKTLYSLVQLNHIQS